MLRSVWVRVQGAALRVLFTTLPAFGHAAPLCALAAELHLRGHTITWVADPVLREHLLPDRAEFVGAPAPPPTSTPARGRMVASVRAYFTRDLPASVQAMLPVLAHRLAQDPPDLVVVEQNCVAGVIAAEQAGIPWVCVHVTPMLLRQPFRDLPGIDAWVDAQVGQIFRARGCAPLTWPLRSPTLDLIGTSRAFLGEDVSLEPHEHAVGAMIAHRRRGAAIEGLVRSERARILVTLGTLTAEAGAAFVRRATEALAELGDVFVVGHDPVPHARTVRPWVDVLACLPHVDAVLTHAGQGTVNEALAHGLPLLCAPVRFDQPAVAARVADLGAGVRLSLEHASTESIREEGARILGDSSYRERASALSVGLRGGASRAADHIEALSP